MTGVPPVVLPPLGPPVAVEPEAEPEFVLVPLATEAAARPLWMLLGPDLLALVPFPLVRGVVPVPLVLVPLVLVLLVLVLLVLVLLVLVPLVLVPLVLVPLDPALRAVPVLPALEREPPWRVWCLALPSTTGLLPLVYEGRPRVLLLPPNCALPMPMPTTAAVAPVASTDSPAMPASDRGTPRRVCPNIFTTYTLGGVTAAPRSNPAAPPRGRGGRCRAPATGCIGKNTSWLETREHWAVRAHFGAAVRTRIRELPADIAAPDCPLIIAHRRLSRADLPR